ncbi:hypothetical protein DBV15_10479 [Temnothorax longispinosus]|uniref:Uncharacterized protein n=1 Tax=Temnothorax longispinosus TaxID=300112 RepID=A0A4S2L5N1_9HYME|nr:hypothetical protein DBV15_10479 [Temnothorax longispinosus]
MRVLMYLFLLLAVIGILFGEAIDAAKVTRDGSLDSLYEDCYGECFQKFKNENACVRLCCIRLKNYPGGDTYPPCRKFYIKTD